MGLLARFPDSILGFTVRNAIVRRHRKCGSGVHGSALCAAACAATFRSSDARPDVRCASGKAKNT